MRSHGDLNRFTGISVEIFLGRSGGSPGEPLGGHLGPFIFLRGPWGDPLGTLGKGRWGGPGGLCPVFSVSKKILRKHRKIKEQKKNDPKRNFGIQLYRNHCFCKAWGLLGVPKGAIAGGSGGAGEV
jgi:hypothetical protein